MQSVKGFKKDPKMVDSDNEAMISRLFDKVNLKSQINTNISQSPVSLKQKNTYISRSNHLSPKIRSYPHVNSIAQHKDLVNSPSQKRRLYSKK